MIFILLAFSPTNFAYAQVDGYVQLAPLPGTTGDDGVCVSDQEGPTQDGCQTTLEKYIPAIFKLLIGVAAALAVIMIVIGGIQYIGSESLWGKQDGREKIEKALMGLLLAIFAWLLLYTINPDLVNLDLNIPETEFPEAPTPVSTQPSLQEELAETQEQGLNTFWVAKRGSSYILYSQGEPSQCVPPTVFHGVEEGYGSFEGYTQCTEFIHAQGLPTEINLPQCILYECYNNTVGVDSN